MKREKRDMVASAWIGAFILGFSLTMVASQASADRPADAGEVIVLSDDIRKNTTEVKHAKSGNEDNKSGLGDGTNPGAGGGTDNASNTGTDNPNESGNEDNKSGLGDGTNPGKGGGKANAKNSGTGNPNQSKKKK